MDEHILNELHELHAELQKDKAAELHSIRSLTPYQLQVKILQKLILIQYELKWKEILETYDKKMQTSER
ncbi:MAG: hypothetical protein J6V44_11575 [Methanobrevibacter sp.]|nr:hypothetical protein [Methanobrevibacter sp.]